MKYGALPISLGLHEVECTEMMFYQYMPIKLSGFNEIKSEIRLRCFDSLIGTCACDYVARNGLNAFISANIYISAKYLFQSAGCPFNRPGWHSDGFMTDDVNYIWCDKYPTVFNTSEYALTQHHEFSLTEMDQQSLKDNEIRYAEKELLRLDQFNIHKVAEVTESGMRAFFKLSFSKEQYNLLGNSRNYAIDYNWEMKPRQIIRNHPVK